MSWSDRVRLFSIVQKKTLFKVSAMGGFALQFEITIDLVGFSTNFTKYFDFLSIRTLYETTSDAR